MDPSAAEGERVNHPKIKKKCLKISERDIADKSQNFRYLHNAWSVSK